MTKDKHEAKLAPNDFTLEAPNFAALTPLSFLQRAERVFADLTAVIYGTYSCTWRHFGHRCRQLARALHGAGLNPGETVSIIADNIPAAIEACFGIPMVGGVINAINTRLDAEAVAYILDHADTKVFLVDQRYTAIAAEAISISQREIVMIEIVETCGETSPSSSARTYEDFLSGDDCEGAFHLPPIDERGPIALNYTSGTTGKPKGVILHHRGAYLNAIGNALSWQMPHYPVYLWSLPLFHCNGWCFPWTIALQGGTHVCVRGVDPAAFLDLVDIHEVTHLCGAPIVVRMLVEAAISSSKKRTRIISVMTAGAAPPAAVLQQAEEAGFDITHTYGLTEVYGPCTVCAWRPEWDDLPLEKKAELKARQGIGYPVVGAVVVMDPETMRPVPSDGETMGEVMFRGNIVMSEYLNDLEATKKAFSGGYFHSGDLAVVHADGYIEIRDRSKDIIISGGENISSIEVEGVLNSHPAVVAAAVVAAPHEKWGETPQAFIEVIDGKQINSDEIITFCRARLAHFKCPTRVTFMQLPKTSTGKIQKFELRKIAGAVAG